MRSLAFECLEQRSLLAGDLGALSLNDAPPADTSVAEVSSIEPRVGFSFELTRPDGSPLTSLAVGEEFVLHAFVQDLHHSPRGVFAAYLDVEWDPAKAVSTGVVGYGDAYPNGRHANVVKPGLIDETGAFAYVDLPRGSRLELFNATLQALAPGMLKFKGNPADVDAQRDVLVHAREGESSFVPDKATIFTGVSIEVMEAVTPVTDASDESDATTDLAPATVQLPSANHPLGQGEGPSGPIAEATVADTGPESVVTSAEAQSTDALVAAVVDFAALGNIGLLGALAAFSDSVTLSTLGNPAAKTLLAIDQPSTLSKPLELSTTATSAASIAPSSDTSATGEDEDEVMALDAALDADEYKV